MSGVYKITNIKNNKFYIGSTIERFERRWSAHIRSLRRGKHSNPLLQSSWDEYGESAFVFEVLENVDSQDVVTEREQYWLDLSFIPEMCYNKKRTISERVNSSELKSRTNDTRLTLAEAIRVKRFVTDTYGDNIKLRFLTGYSPNEIVHKLTIANVRPEEVARMAGRENGKNK